MRQKKQNNDLFSDGRFQNTALLMDLERGNVIAGYGGLTEPLDLNKNILICVPKINEGLTGVKRHEGE